MILHMRDPAVDRRVLPCHAPGSRLTSLESATRSTARSRACRSATSAVPARTVRLASVVTIGGTMRRTHETHEQAGKYLGGIPELIARTKTVVADLPRLWCTPGSLSAASQRSCWRRPGPVRKVSSCCTPRFQSRNSKYGRGLQECGPGSLRHRGSLSRATRARRLRAGGPRVGPQVSRDPRPRAKSSRTPCPAIFQLGSRIRVACLRG
jgi:hypothetical protein